MKRFLSFTALLVLLLSSLSLGHAVVVTIGTNGSYTQFNPFNASNGYGRSLGLYSSAQIGHYGLVTSLGWSVSHRGLGAIPYKIYVKVTTETTLTQMPWADFTASATLVKEGIYTFNTVGWHTFTLDNTFNYVGANLLIGVEANYGGSGAGSGNYPRFHYTSGIPSSHQDWPQNDSPSIELGNVNQSLPNLRIGLADPATNPNLYLEPSGHDFGRVPIGTTAGKTFIIGNYGQGTLTVTGLSPMSSDCFSITNAPDFPVALTAGQIATFDIQYAPTAAGNHAATFAITDNSPATRYFTVGGEGFDSTISGFPYLQNFDGSWTGSPAAPEGWKVINVDNDYFTWKRSGRDINPTYSQPFAAHGRGSTDDWLISPPIDLTGRDVRLKWWDRAQIFNRPATYRVMVSTTMPEIASFTDELASIVCANTAWTERTLNLDAYNGQTIYVAFHQYAPSTSLYCFGIDDFLLEEMTAAPIFTYTPNHIDFAGVYVNTATAYQDVTITNDGSGTLSLDAANISIVGTDAAMFEFDPINLPFALGEYQSGVIPVRYHPTAIGIHTAILRIVYNADIYDVVLDGRAVGENALIQGFESISFPPHGWSLYNGGSGYTWFWSYSNPRTGYGHAQINDDFVAHDDWLITPKLAPSAENHTFTFYGCNDSPYWQDRFNVLVSTTGLTLASFTDVLDTNVQTGGLEYMLHSYDLSDYIGQEIYVAIQAISTNQWRLQIDDVCGPDIIPFPAPEVQVTISGSDVILEWEPVPEATSYKVYASENPYYFGTGPIATVDTNSCTLPATQAKRFFRVVSCANP